MHYLITTKKVLKKNPYAFAGYKITDGNRGWGKDDLRFSYTEDNQLKKNLRNTMVIYF